MLIYNTLLKIVLGWERNFKSLQIFYKTFSTKKYKYFLKYLTIFSNKNWKF